MEIKLLLRLDNQNTWLKFGSEFEKALVIVDKRFKQPKKCTDLCLLYDCSITRFIYIYIYIYGPGGRALALESLVKILSLRLPPIYHQ